MQLCTASGKVKWMMLHGYLTCLYKRIKNYSEDIQSHQHERQVECEIGILLFKEMEMTRETSNNSRTVVAQTVK